MTDKELDDRVMQVFTTSHDRKTLMLLATVYEEAKELRYVKKPLAWALYQVWKMEDEG